MGRKLDMEKDDGLTLHLLERDSQVGAVTSRNIINAIDHSKRVILVLSRYMCPLFTLADPGALPVCAPSLNRFQFFCFCIHFC